MSRLLPPHCLAAFFVVAGGAALAQTGDRVIHGGKGTAVIYGESTPTPGSGRRARQTRPAGAFSRIVTDDAVDVEVRIGARPAIEVEADDNLVGRMTARIAGGTLQLGLRGGYRTDRAPIARVTLPRLDAVHLQTSSNGSIFGLNGGTLRLTSVGSGSFVANGRVTVLEVEMDGSGNADLDRLAAARAQIVVNGTGHVRVNAGDVLVAIVNGTGRISYRGSPRVLRRDVNGPGSIDRAGN